MELYAPGLPSIPKHLVFLIVTACCASLFPYSLSSDAQYEFCRYNNTCDNITFQYPFGVGKHGCGDPRFQIVCVQNSNPVIEINDQDYTILQSYQNNTFEIVKGQECQFSEGLQASEFAGSDFSITSSLKLTLKVYQCSTPLVAATGLVRKCNDTFYYTLNDMGYLVPSCVVAEQVTVYAGISELLYNDTQRNESCTSCRESGGTCGYNVSVTDGVAPFLCYCMDGARINKCSGKGKKGTNGVAIGVSAGAAVFIAAGLLVGITLCAKRRKVASSRSVSKVEEFLQEYADQMPTRYSLSQIKKITNNFAEKLGEGGFGVVYKGKLRNGTLVAVKLLDRHRHGESTDFMNEVATIGRLHHVNLVRLLGYCFESFTSALVYEFMANGSLEKFIFAGKEKGRLLTWENLYSIALGAARGIAYLHQDCEKRIIHFDIKPHNILLDADFTPKVSDFGLAKLCRKGDDHISMTAARGTPGYVAPEVCDRALGPVTDKSDVYSFGMLLLEIVGERKNFDWKVSHSSQFYFPEWAFKLLERGELGMRLRGGEVDVEDEEKARRMTKVGLWCIQYNYKDRPSMSSVVEMLQGNGGDVANPPLPSNPHSASPEKPLLSSAEESSSI
eukprot:PITA_08698